jgi:hypothetical protein
MYHSTINRFIYVRAKTSYLKELAVILDFNQCVSLLKVSRAKPGKKLSIGTVRDEIWKQHASVDTTL